ncbi:hypothetical protein DQP55_16135 [Mycolicibacterium sp. GF69]|uniref:hypothetical protein n=1 Tax=Mycolicibacterium sp. GF69 TaxID=2267251 RepID=UPI000DCF4841|nr:hypothetical protein [Mycolicibacterium sp. GF69]RAV10022.1 hypothetical protein DQP55_16135 [Mycolicibacterium sp. GF69]
MPLETDPSILHAVQTVYTTDLGLPEEWTDAQRTEFIADEADKITWMGRAQASTLGDQSVEQWTRRHDGRAPDPGVLSALRIAARARALHVVLSTELYELITPDTEDGNPDQVGQHHDDWRA